MLCLWVGRQDGVCARVPMGGGMSGRSLSVFWNSLQALWGLGAVQGPGKIEDHKVAKIIVFYNVPASQTFLGHIIPELRVEKTHCISQCSSFGKRSVVSDAKNVK